MEKSYNECINTPEGRIKGCAYCEEKHVCPDAFTEIADKCGKFDFSLMDNLKEE